MKGTYIFAVYGKKAGSFIISATYNEHSIVSISENLPLRDNQMAYETKLYRYVPNQKEEQRDDIIIRFQVSSGVGELFVSIYDQTDDTVTLPERLPVSKRQAFYSLDEVTPSSDVSQQEVIISAGDKYYCRNCQYLIGVHSLDEPVAYEITANLGQTSFEKGHMIRVGSPKEISLESGQTKIFRFIIEDPSQVKVSFNQKLG